MVGVSAPNRKGEVPHIPFWHHIINLDYPIIGDPRCALSPRSNAADTVGPVVPRAHLAHDIRRLCRRHLPLLNRCEGTDTTPPPAG